MNVNQSLYEVIASRANQNPNFIALQFMGKRITYFDLLQNIDKSAFGLSQLGIKKGNVITICMPNVFEVIYTFYAGVKLGAICHMVHPLTPVKQLKTQMIETNSKLLMVVDTFYDTYHLMTKELNVPLILVTPVDSFGLIKKVGYKVINKKRLANIQVDNLVIPYKKLIEKNGHIETASVDSKTSAVYLHSGGTSGTPKTIELSHFSINSLANQTEYILDEHDFENKHMLAVLPMFHGFGLCMGVHAMLVYGGVDTLMPKFNAKDTINLIKKNQINYLIGVPTLFEALLNTNDFAGPHLKNLKQAFVGGDYVSPTLKERFNKVMAENNSHAQLLEGYGLTEVVTVCAVNTIFEQKLGTVGKPLPGIDIKIVDLETKEVLPVNTLGEIAVSGPTRMNGYLHDKLATSSTFKKIDDKIYVLTGDYGMIDDEGYVVFKQRLKRIIKVSGMPVLPSEIETLVSALPGISEVAAVGVKDQERGNMIKLFVTIKPGAEIKVTDDEIKQMIKAELSIYAVPKSIVYLDKMPKTIIGKIDTKILETLE
jgi:long-chain acyl-CoA synthetase